MPGSLRFPPVGRWSWRLTACAVAAMGAAAFATGDLRAQQAQQNVNVLPVVLPTDPTDPASIDTAAWVGDLYLQRQVEPTIAISTRNPEHILAFFNDYRAVDISGDIGMGEQSPLNFGAATWRFIKGLAARLVGRDKAPVRRRGPHPDIAAAAEAWVGGARSYDGGHTFTGLFVPGAPFDSSPAGLASPLKGFAAATDPVLAAAPCGKFYLALLGFTRYGASRMVVARYQDDNNAEGGDTIRYVGMTVLEDANNSQWGYFLDKPAIAVDVKRGMSAGCGHHVYVSYTTFNGLTKDGKTQSKLTVARSTDSGATFATTKINQPYQQGQGTALAVDPQTGALYVAWRHFNSPDTIFVHKSTNFGQTWSGQPVDLLARNADAPRLRKFDQPTVSTDAGSSAALTFRSLSFPTIAAAPGAVFVAFTERVDTDPTSPGFKKPMTDGSPRIMLMRSSDGGATWASVPDGSSPAVLNGRRAIDTADRDVPCSDAACTPTPAGFGYLPQHRPSGPQVMPQLTFAGGRLMLVYYESRGWAYQSPESIDGRMDILPNPGGYVAGLPRLLDVRAAVLNATTGELQGSAQVSRYPLKPWLKQVDGRLVPETLADVVAVNWPCAPDVEGATAPCVRAVNRVNSPTSSAGTSPFIGDYIGVAGVQFVPNPDQSGWAWAMTPEILPSRLFHGIFTDARNLIPPINPEDLESWKSYSPPWKPGSCVNAGSRNTDVLTARIDTDLAISAPTSYKELVGIQRAFPLVVTNGTATNRFFRLSFATGGSLASFAQQAYDYSETPPALVDINVNHLDVLVFAFSSVTRVAYIKPGAPAVRIEAREIEGPLDPETGSGGDAIAGGLYAAITLNADASNPWLGLTDTETHAPSIGAPSIGAPSIGAPSIGAPSIGAPSIGAPSIGAPSIGAPSIGASAPGEDTVYGYVDTIWTVEDQGNTASGYLSYAHVDNPERYEGYYRFQLMVVKSSTNGTLSGCESSNVQQDEILANVPLSTADLRNPSIGAPSIGAPSIGAPSIGAPSIGAVSFASSPPAENGGSDGTLKAPTPRVPVIVVLRAYRVRPFDAPGADVIFEPSKDVPSLAVKALSKDVIDGILQDDITVAVRGADLIAAVLGTGLPIPTVSAGDSLTFPAGGWALNNIGNVPAASVDGSIEHSVYLSAAGGLTPVTRISTPEDWITTGAVASGQTLLYPGASIRIPIGTPPGSYRLFVLADDGSQSVNGQVSELDESNNVSAGVSVEVTAPTTPPVAADDSYSLSEDTQLNVSAPGLLGNDTNPNQGVLTAELVTGSSHGTTTLGPDGSFSYSPDLNYSGGDEFAYRVSDGVSRSDVAVVRLVIEARNDRPIAAVESYTLDEDTTLTMPAPGVLANDSDVDGDTLTAALLASPAHGTVAVSPDGGFVYTPSPDYGGADGFTYTVADGSGAAATGTVSLVVRPVNDSPAVLNDSYSVNENSTLALTATQGVLANDTDRDDDPLSAELVSNVQHGVLALSASGALTYRPHANFVGLDTFSYRASDGTLASAIATVTITISGFAVDFGFNGLLSPWTETPVFTAKRGNAVPLSWQYTLNGVAVDSSALTPQLRFTKMSGDAATGDPCGGSELMPGPDGGPILNQNTPGSTFFQYINTRQQPHTWQFNWKTDDPLFTKGCWLARIYLRETLQLDRPDGFRILLR